MSSPGSRALVRGRGARTRRGVRARVAGVASRDLGEQIRVQLPSYLCDCATQFISAARGCRVRLPLSRARVATRPLAFLVSGSTADSASSRAHRDEGRGDTGVKGLAGDNHGQDPAAGRRWQQLWSPSASR